MPELPLFTDAANPNPDSVSRLGQQATDCLRDLRAARTLNDDATATEAEWRMELILDALSDIYKMRRARAAG